MRRLAGIVGAVARQALADRGLGWVTVLDDGTPEARLAFELLASGLGAERVRLEPDERQLEPVLHALGARSDPDAARARDEVRRLLARLVPDALIANPANKTALLLSGLLPPDPFFPLGDLYASEVRELTGDWSAPPRVQRLAQRAGGVEALDEALREVFDRRDPRGLLLLAPEVAEAVRAALAAGRAARVQPHVVPKIGARTLGVDLLE